MATGNSERHPLESSMVSKIPAKQDTSYFPHVGGYPARRPTGVDMALGLSGYAVKVIVCLFSKVLSAWCNIFSTTLVHLY